MKKCWQCFRCPRKEKPLNPFGKERADPRSLARAVTRLDDLEVSSCPLLQKSRE